MKRKNKKTIKVLGIGLSILAVVILIVFVFGLLQSQQVNTRITDASSSLISDNPEATIFAISYRASARNPSCDETSSYPIKFTVNSDQKADTSILRDAKMPQIVEDGIYETNDVTIGGLASATGICSDIPQGRNIEIENPKAVCTIYRRVATGQQIEGSVFSNDLLGYDCEVTATLYPTYNGERAGGHLFGGVSGTITLTIPKNNQLIDTEIPDAETEYVADSGLNTDVSSTTTYTQTETDNDLSTQTSLSETSGDTPAGSTEPASIPIIGYIIPGVIGLLLLLLAIALIRRYRK